MNNVHVIRDLRTKRVQIGKKQILQETDFKVCSITTIQPNVYFESYEFNLVHTPLKILQKKIQLKKIGNEQDI